VSLTSTDDKASGKPHAQRRSGPMNGKQVGRWIDSARSRLRVLLALLLVPITLTACTFTTTPPPPTLPNVNANEKFDLSVFHVAPGATFVNEDNQAAESGRLIDGDRYSQARMKSRNYHFDRPISPAEFWKWALSVYPPPGFTLSTEQPEINNDLICIQDKPNGARHHIQVALLFPSEDRKRLEVADYTIIYSL
jgi:hypothetical protein